MKKYLILLVLLACFGCNEPGPLLTWKIKCYTPDGELFETKYYYSSYKPQIYHLNSGTYIKAESGWIYDAPVGWKVTLDYEKF